MTGASQAAGDCGPGSRGPVLVWFRRDLRLADNPALAEAAGSGRPVVPVYILDETPDCRRFGGAALWWLHGSLRSLGESLESAGSRLILRRGRAGEALAELVRETGASAVFWNRLHDPLPVARDRKIMSGLREGGLDVRSFNSALLFEPWRVSTKSGSPCRVFTPFWRSCLAREFDQPVAMPVLPAAPASWPASDVLDDWELRPTSPDWASGLRAEWRPGEAGAARRLESFLEGARVERYGEDRDVPGQPGTSMLSPHLAFGEIGPRQIVDALAALGPDAERGAFVRELGWREFCHHLLFHNPEMGERNLRPEFDRMPWREDAAALRLWQRGKTGYPFVDAGMRELRTRGWMHNRLRMIVASFLTKHLLIDWRLGAAWFWDSLVDADWANNSAGWQWTAGSGADAAPYFRIFNPVAQSKRHDPDGAYLRTWLPELARLPDRLIHAPWQATESELAEAGVELGATYPLPVVDHSFARQRALDTYASRIRGGS